MGSKRIGSLFVLVIALSIAFSSFAYASSAPSSWAEKEVASARAEGLVTNAVTRDYQANITREQFCELVILAYEKIKGEQAQPGNISFNDTNNTQVLKAANLGIVTGYGNGTFAPDDLVTREQIATMLVRMIDKAVDYLDVNNESRDSFADRSLISEWARQSVNYACENNIIYGVGDNYFSPKSNTTCEQAILLGYRVVKQYADVVSVGEREGNVDEYNNTVAEELSFLGKTFADVVIAYGDNYDTFKYNYGDPGICLAFDDLGMAFASAGMNFHFIVDYSGSVNMNTVIKSIYPYGENVPTAYGFTSDCTYSEFLSCLSKLGLTENDIYLEHYTEEESIDGESYYAALDYGDYRFEYLWYPMGTNSLAQTKAYMSKITKR